MIVFLLFLPTTTTRPLIGGKNEKAIVAILQRKKTILRITSPIVLAPKQSNFLLKSF